MLHDSELAAIEARLAAATPGPWRWAGNVDYDDPRLVSRSGFRDIIGHIPVERSSNDRRADAYREYLRDTQTRESTKEPWRHLTDAEIEERVTEEYVLDPESGLPRRDDRMAFVVDGFYHEARTLAVFEVCPDATERDDPRVYRADIVGLRHPNAELIAHAPEDMRALLDALKEREQRLKDLQWAEVLTSQGCPAGKHMDWLADTEFLYQCPWCEIEQLRGSVKYAREMEDRARMRAERAEAAA